MKLLKSLLEAPRQKFELLDLSGPIDDELFAEMINEHDLLIMFNGITMPNIFTDINEQFRAHAAFYEGPDKKKPASLAGGPSTIYVVYHIKDKAFYARCVWGMKLHKGTGTFPFDLHMAMKLWAPNEIRATKLEVKVGVQESNELADKFKGASSEVLDLRKIFKAAGKNVVSVAMISGSED